MVERLVESAQCKATLCGEAHVNHIMHIVFTHKNINTAASANISVLTVYQFKKLLWILRT